MITKGVLRKRYIARRKSLLAGALAQKSLIIGQRFLANSRLTSKKTFSIYLPVNNEVETHYIINALLDQEKKVLLPCYSARDREYHFCEFKNFDDLEEGPYGILQPSPLVISSSLSSSSPSLRVDDLRAEGLRSPKDNEGSVIDSSKVEVAIIPGVAFDRRGVRLGYGKGVYDQLVGKSNALKIGLAYDFQVLEKLPKEEHDLEIDILITEARVLRFTKTS